MHIYMSINTYLYAYIYVYIQVFIILLFRAEKMKKNELNSALQWENEQILAIDARANQIEELNNLGQLYTYIHMYIYICE
jgi:hypothetical protein